MQPNLAQEKKLRKKGYKIIGCLDEVGRGSLAGPVMAVIVVTSLISNFQFLKGIKDSKKLSLKKREKNYKILINHPQIKWGVGRVSEKIIDKINIFEATKLAMKKAVRNLEKKIAKNFKIDFLILDGRMKLDLEIPQKSIIKADEKIFSCACASIIAKVKRDKIMKNYSKIYPLYRFEKNKGYPTKEHLRFIKKYGCCKIHRKTFSPVVKIK